MRSHQFLSFLGFLLLPHILQAAPSSCPSSLRFAIGSYTNIPWRPDFTGEGLVIAKLTSTGVNKTAVVPPSEVGDNPAYCALNSHRTLYCCTGGNTSAMTRLPKIRHLPHELVRRAVHPSSGANHIAVLHNKARSGDTYSGDRVLVADYNGQLLSFVVQGVNAHYWDVHNFTIPAHLASNATKRQKSPHPHQTLPLDNGDVLVSDLGADVVHRFAIGGYGEIYWKEFVRLEMGDGPRHAAQHPKLKDVVYVVNELSLTVVRLRIGKCEGKERLAKGAFVKCERSSLVDGTNKGATAAAIRVSADGRYLYASVRYGGMETLGSIVGFAIKLDGRIGKRIGIWSSQGIRPRDFSIIERFEGENGSCQSYLAIANRDSNNVVFVRRDADTGVVDSSARFTLSVKTPTSVLEV